VNAAQFWAEGLACRLYMAVEDVRDVEDSWADGGESWEIHVDDRGIAYTHAWAPWGPLYLDELPESCTCGHDRDDHSGRGACVHIAGSLVDGATLCGCRAFEAAP
jgi:hypothetical protein